MSRLDNAIGSRLVGSLLSAAGETYTYKRGAQEEDVTAAKSGQRTDVMDSQGMVIATELADFKMRTADLPFGTPLPGDQFHKGGLIWRAVELAGEKCFYVQSPQMIRIHTIRIA